VGGGSYVAAVCFDKFYRRHSCWGRLLSVASIFPNLESKSGAVSLIHFRGSSPPTHSGSFASLSPLPFAHLIFPVLAYSPFVCLPHFFLRFFSSFLVGHVKKMGKVMIYTFNNFSPIHERKQWRHFSKSLKRCLSNLWGDLSLRNVVFGTFCSSNASSPVRFREIKKS